MWDIHRREHSVSVGLLLSSLWYKPRTQQPFPWRPKSKSQKNKIAVRNIQKSCNKNNFFKFKSNKRRAFSLICSLFKSLLVQLSRGLLLLLCLNSTSFWVLFENLQVENPRILMPQDHWLKRSLQETSQMFGKTILKAAKSGLCADLQATGSCSCWLSAGLCGHGELASPLSSSIYDLPQQERFSQGSRVWTSRNSLYQRLSEDKAILNHFPTLQCPKILSLR